MVSMSARIRFCRILVPPCLSICLSVRPLGHLRHDLGMYVRLLVDEGLLLFQARNWIAKKGRRERKMKVEWNEVGWAG